MPVRSPLLRLLARRTLISLPVLLGISLLSFLVVNYLPGNTARQFAGAGATADQIARLERELNLHLPIWERYGEWLAGVLTGDFGHSLASGQPVAGLIAERLPVTLELAGYAFVLALGLAVPMALLAARKPFGLVDRLSGILSITSLSLANYVLAIILVLLFSLQWRLFPSLGFTPLSDGLAGNLRSLTLPAIAIAFPLFGFYARLLRGDLIAQLQGRDYITAAAAKGLGPWSILLRHALRNAVFGLLTVTALNMGMLIGGTVVIEQIFALPGLGQLLLQAAGLRDVVVVQAIVLLLAIVTLLANMLADMAYLLLDPRIRHARA